ncbi:MAG: nucleotidyltransferase family protein [Acidobacteria bacterium]|nr:nucleotidyltransferase family protein [Acidobacteriota bacterium]
MATNSTFPDLRRDLVRYIIRSMIVPVILAAGESRRMGQPKPLLPIFQTTFLEHIVDVLKTLNFPTIKIVLGHEADLIQRRTRLVGSDIVFNPHYADGQLTSLQAAIRHVIETAEPAAGILVCLVDNPLLDPEVVRALLQGFEQSGQPIIVPTCHGRRGHPVLLAKSLYRELLLAPIDQGAKAVVRKVPERVLEVETGNDTILVDVDTPEKYRDLCRRL